MAYGISCYTWFLLFVNSSILWIPLGLVLIITFLSLNYRIDDLVDELFFDTKNKGPIKLILLTCSVVFFASSSYGLIHLINKISSNNLNVFFLPAIIFIIFFAGVSIGIFQIKE